LWVILARFVGNLVSSAKAWHRQGDVMPLWLKSLDCDSCKEHRRTRKGGFRKISTIQEEIREKRKRKKRKKQRKKRKRRWDMQLGLNIFT
jgi:hypothetical protein